MKNHPISLAILAAAAWVACLERAARSDDATASLEWSICDSSSESVLQKLGAMDTDPDKSDEITFYDSNPPVYLQQGLEFRTKDKSHGFESLVKARFNSEVAAVPSDASCVWERYGTQESYACGEQNRSGDENALWSDGQSSFAGRYFTVNWANLVGFGPYQDPKWQVSIAGQNAVFDNAVSDYGQLMELEIQVSKSDDESVYESVTQALTQAGVGLCPVQEGKTFRLFRAMGLLP